MKKVRIIKVTDEVFKGEHPNNINEGYTKVGYIHDDAPTEGNSLFLLDSNGFPIFWTSTIETILNKEFFKTRNSFYKIEYLDE